MGGPRPPVLRGAGPTRLTWGRGPVMDGSCLRPAGHGHCGIGIGLRCALARQPQRGGAGVRCLCLRTSRPTLNLPTSFNNWSPSQSSPDYGAPLFSLSALHQALTMNCKEFIAKVRAEASKRSFSPERSDSCLASDPRPRDLREGGVWSGVGRRCCQGRRELLPVSPFPPAFLPLHASVFIFLVFKSDSPPTSVSSHHSHERQTMDFIYGLKGGKEHSAFGDTKECKAHTVTWAVSREK